MSRNTIDQVGESPRETVRCIQPNVSLQKKHGLQLPLSVSVSRQQI